MKMENTESEAPSIGVAATKPKTETDQEPQGLCHLCAKIDLGSLVSQEGYGHVATVEEAKTCRRTCRLCWHVFNDDKFHEWEVGIRMFENNGPVRVKWAQDSRVCIEFLIPAFEARKSVLFFVRRRGTSTFFWWT